MEKSNLPGKESKIEIVKMSPDLRIRMERITNFNKEVENIKSIRTYQTEMAELNIIFELKKKIH